VLNGVWHVFSTVAGLAADDRLDSDELGQTATKPAWEGGYGVNQYGYEIAPYPTPFDHGWTCIVEWDFTYG
jgi:hypothetical protein